MLPLLVLIFIASTVMQLYFWAFRFHYLSKVQHKPAIHSGPSVSIVICARDESPQLSQNLPLILSQNYEHFEVIVVDDQSVDKSVEVLTNLSRENPILIVGSTSSSRQGKKNALQTGIDLASHELLVFTDADCAPASYDWLGTMISPLIEGCQFALGVAPLRRTKGMANAFSCYEGGLTYLLYGSAIMLDMPYMGVGRNMAYRKTIALTYVPDRNFISGDDDLVVNAMALSEDSWLVADQSAYMYSQGKNSWSSFLNQKRRHVSVSWEYKWRDKIWLACFACTHWIHLVLAIVLVVFGLYEIVISLYLIRSMIVIIQSKKLMPHDGNQFGASTVFLDFLFVFYYPVIAFFLMIKPPKKW